MHFRVQTAFAVTFSASVDVHGMLSEKIINKYYEQIRKLKCYQFLVKSESYNFTSPGLVDRFLNVAQILAFGPKICRIFCWDGSAQDTSSAHPARALACSLIIARRRGFLNSSDIIHGFSYNPRNNSWILTQLNISLQ